MQYIATFLLHGDILGLNLQLKSTVQFNSV